MKNNKHKDNENSILSSSEEEEDFFDLRREIFGASEIRSKFNDSIINFLNLENLLLSSSDACAASADDNVGDEEEALVEKDSLIVLEDLTKSVSNFEIIGYEYSNLVESSILDDVKPEPETIPNVSTKANNIPSVTHQISVHESCMNCVALKNQVLNLRNVLSDTREKFDTEKTKWLKEKQEISKQITQKSNLIQEQLKKLSLEKKRIEKNKILSLQLPNKNDRREIEELNAKIKRLEEELKLKNLKRNLHEDRLKRRIDELSQRNEELLQEIKSLTNNNNSPQQKRSSEEISIPSVNPNPNPTTKKVEIVQYANGSCKEIHPDGQVVMRFINGDIKQIMPDGSIMYYFADTMITHTKFNDGSEFVEFPDGQLEKKMADGTLEVVYPDKTTRLIYSTGEEEIIFSDGTISRTDREGRKVIDFPSGSREVYWKDMKQKFEVDGTIKTIYPDGTKEIRYQDGRTRILTSSSSDSFQHNPIN